MNYFVIFLSAIIYIVSAPDLEAAEELKLLASDAPPYISQLPDGSFEGQFYDRMACVLDKMEQPFSTELKPWMRVQAEVEQGKAEGFFPTTKSEFRDAYATFTDSLLDPKFYLYYLRDSALKPDSPDFNEKAKVSVLWGTLLYQELASAGNMLGPEAHSFEALFELLDRGRVDAVLLSGDIASILLKERGTSDKYMRTVHSSRPMGVYLSNVFLEKQPTFLSRFNKEINGCALEHPID